MKSKIVFGDFLKHDFGGKKFSGIFVKDVLHLFPSGERTKVFEKIKKLLKDRGLIYFSVSTRDGGKYFVKKLEEIGFDIVEKKIGNEKYLGKRDFVAICEKR